MTSLKVAIAALLSIATPVLAEGPAAGEPNPMGSMFMLVGFFMIFYFLLWRPQSKRNKEHKALLGKLEKGDEVVTSGGLLGTIIKVSDSFVVMALGENMEVRVQKNAVASCVPKGTLKTV